MMRFLYAEILGCTHYPMVHTAFPKVFGAKVKILSQTNLVAKSLTDYLRRHPDKPGVQTSSKFITMGNPLEVSQRATHFLKRPSIFESA